MRPKDEVAARLQRKAAAVRDFLSSPGGKAVMEILEEEFHDGDMRGTDTHQTYYNLGRRDVVAYLKELAEYGRNKS